MVGLLRKTQLSKVNARHLLEDLASIYSYPVEEAVIVELVANALDAKASEINILTNGKERTFSVEDNGQGMDELTFEKYHDLAESRKEKGHGIGFAGLGAKLSHMIAHKVLTETRHGHYRDASEWGFSNDDLQWVRVSRKTLRTDGTRVVLRLGIHESKILAPEFVNKAIQYHYGALLEPFVLQLYVWQSIYPQGITLKVNNEPLPSIPWLPQELVLTRTEVDINDARKHRVARAVFILSRKPLAEEHQGIAIAALGKTIQRSFWGVNPRSPEYITGLIEAPELVECLTTDKQRFVEHGRQGERLRRVKKEIQKALRVWLTDIGQVLEQEDRDRASKKLEQETAQIIRHIPELRYLFSAPSREEIALPSSSGQLQAEFKGLAQNSSSLGLGGGGKGTNGLLAPGDQEGEALSISGNGKVPVIARSRRTRRGPSIILVEASTRTEISWIEGNELFINTGHPAYKKAQGEKQLIYHQRFAVYYALCQDAAIEDTAKFALLNKAFTEWGKS